MSFLYCETFAGCGVELGILVLVGLQKVGLQNPPRTGCSLRVCFNADVSSRKN